MRPRPPCPTCGQQGCTLHVRDPRWHHGRPSVERIRGPRLQALRYALFAEHPFCQRCHVNVSTIRDHIVPLAEGGADDRANTQALCKTCNDAKAIDEAQRGRRR